MKFANCTMKNGKSPTPNRDRQSAIIVGSRVRYWRARPALDSPWYQIAPLIANGTRGAIMPSPRLATPLGLG